MIEPADCERCRLAKRDRAKQTAEEWLALTMRSGQIIDTRDGLPVISAVVLPFAGERHFAGMPAPALVHWDIAAFRCPFSRAMFRPILSHMLARFAPDEAPIRVAWFDARGCIHRFSHCPVFRENYLVKPTADPALPRRLLKPIR